MNGTLKLALKYIVYNQFKSLILIGCIFLTALLPIAIKLLLWQFNEKILARADATPVVIGATGSRLDLALHALYFKTQSPADIRMGETTRIRESGLANPIPIISKFTARKYPIVGTTVDYFEFRQLQLKAGTLFAMLGECVLGASVAEALRLRIGDQLLSDRENVLDIAGLYPLKMRVAGILARSHSADDHAVFVDLKTVWVIAGLGHGHQDLANETDAGKILARTDSRIIASAAVLPFTEVTAENLESFHFHGDLEQFPLTAIIAIPPDIKSKTLLEGQYDVGDQALQFVRPSETVRELMEMVFQIKLFFDANAILIAISTLLLLVLVVMLSLRLRQREMQTMFKIGCSRGTIAMLQCWELAIVFAIAMVLVTVAAWGIWSISGDLVESLLLRT